MGLKLIRWGTPEIIEFEDDLIFPPWTQCFLLETVLVWAHFLLRRNARVLLAK